MCSGSSSSTGVPGDLPNGRAEDHSAPANRVDLVFEINEGPTTGVAAINFIGNRVFADADLREQIATTTSAWWKFLTTNDN